MLGKFISAEYDAVINVLVTVEQYTRIFFKITDCLFLDLEVYLIQVALPSNRLTTQGGKLISEQVTPEENLMCQHLSGIR